MKIALCQINPIVGAFGHNSKLILKNYNKHKLLNVDIVVFPELSITGYPPQDLLLENNFVKKNLETLSLIAKQSTIPIICGYVRKDESGIFNSAAVCYNGKIQFTYDKILLPTYDVFDEERYFTSGSSPSVFTLPIGDQLVKIGLQICEDLWDDDYDCKVTDLQKENGAEIIINISASPFNEGRLLKRRDLISNKVNKIGIPFLYCNMVGAQDELIFDGESLAFSKDAYPIAQGNSFIEDVIIVDTNSTQKIDLKVQPRVEKMYNALVLGVSDYFIKTGNHQAVIGLSGGIDSALVASIASDALGSENVHGISLPSKYSSNHSLSDAKLLSENLGIDYQIISIQEAVDGLETTLYPQFLGLDINVTEENIQARSRGNILMALSNKFGWMVLSTGNKTELALGYCTLYGDMSGGLSVISDLSKADVYALAKWINSKRKNRIPSGSITKPPSAELAPDQVDPFDYSLVSPLVDLIVEERKSISEIVKAGYDQELVNSVYQKIRLNEYKRRQAAPGLRVSNKAFGIGRRIPIVNHYKGQ